jgi:hypothetical protein
MPILDGRRSQGSFGAPLNEMRHSPEEWEENSRPTVFTESKGARRHLHVSMGLKSNSDQPESWEEARQFRNADSTHPLRGAPFHRAAGEGAAPRGARVRTGAHPGYRSTLREFGVLRGARDRRAREGADSWAFLRV